MKLIRDKECGKLRPMTVAEEAEELSAAFRAVLIALCEAIGIDKLATWVDKKIRNRYHNGMNGL